MGTATTFLLVTDTAMPVGMTMGAGGMVTRTV